MYIILEQYVYIGYFGDFQTPLKVINSFYRFHTARLQVSRMFEELCFLPQMLLYVIMLFQLL